MAEALGVASAIAALVTLAAQLSKLSYNVISDIREASKQEKQYLREVSALTDAILRAEEAVNSFEALQINAPRPKTLSGDIIKECETELLSLKAELEKHSRRIFWVIKEQGLRKRIENLQRFRGVFHGYVATQTLVASTGIYGEITKLSFEEIRRGLLQWLHVTEDSSATPPDPYPGTGQWFLRSDEYKKWIAGSSSKTLWCTGPPGVGKSGIASIVCNDRLDSSGPLESVIRFFCDFSLRKQQNVAAILSSLLFQMINRGSVNIVKTLQSFVQKHMTGHAPTVPLLSRALVIACEAQDFYLIIDGPDELEKPSDVALILSAFSKTSCKVFITSRDVPEIRKAVSGTAPFELHTQFSDLTKYIEGTLHQSDISELIPAASNLIEEVARKSNGLFLLARVLVAQIQDQTSAKEMREVVRSFSPTLSGAFESTLRRIDMQSQPRRDLALRAIGWVTHATRPMTRVELLHALAIDEESGEVDAENLSTITTILKICVGVVLIEGNFDTVKMVHSTAQSWFRNHLGTAYQEVLARTCLSHLRSSVYLSGACASEEELTIRLRQNPFFYYASSAWGWHITSERVEKTLGDSIHALLGNTQLLAASFQALLFRDSLKGLELRTALFQSLPTEQQSLHIAACWNLRRVITSILQKGGNVDCQDSQGWTPLHWACLNRNTEAVETLLTAGANPDLKDSAGWTPMFRAAVNGDLESLKLLLDSGADYSTRDINGWTALKWASSALHTAAVQELLKHHARYRQDFSSVSAEFIRSSSYDQAVKIWNQISFMDDAQNSLIEEKSVVTEMSQSLTVKGVLFNPAGEFWSSGSFDTPLGSFFRLTEKAARARSDSDLFDNEVCGENAEQQGSSIWKGRLLHSAIRDDNINAVRFLIALGADVNSRLLRSTPLHWAAFRRDRKFVDILLECGADHTFTYKGYTPLHRAVSNGFEDTVTALLEGGADVNWNSEQSGQKSALFLACDLPRKYNSSMVKLLLAHGANVHHQYEDGTSAIHWAVRSKNLDTVRMIIDAGANVNGQGRDGRTPLMLACGVRHREGSSDLCLSIVELLLSCGADIHRQDNKGRSAIHSASPRGDCRVIQKLIEAGADCMVLEKDGSNVFHHLNEAIFLTVGSLFDSTSSSSSDLARQEEAAKLYISVVEPCLSLLLKKCPPSMMDAAYESDGFTCTPLLRALLRRDWDLSLALIARGARIPNIEDLNKSSHREIDIWNAFFNCHFDLVQFLLDGGVNLTSNSMKLRCFPEHRFGTFVQADYLKMSSTLGSMIQAGLDVNYHSDSLDDFWYPLLSRRRKRLGPSRMSLSNCQETPFLVKVVRFTESPLLLGSLLKAGADPYRQDGDGLDCFAWSCLELKSHFLELLLLHGRDISRDHWTSNLGFPQKNNERDTISYAFSFLKRTGILDDAFKVTRKIRVSYNLLCHASRANNLDSVKRLIEYGADGAVVAEDRSTPVIFASRNGNLDMLYYLANCGAQLDVQDGSGRTPLHIFADAGNTAGVTFLVSQGCSVDLPDSNGWTPLHLAAQRGNDDILRLILNAGASLAAVTRSRETPLHVAAMYPYGATVEVLLEAGADPNARLQTKNYRGETKEYSVLQYALNARGWYAAEQDWRDRLKVAQMLVDYGADVAGATDHFTIADVLRFRDCQKLWDILRKPVSQRTNSGHSEHS